MSTQNKAKYHTSISGYYVRCHADTKPCPRGGAHISQKEYDQLVAENSPLVKPSGDAPETGYFATARANYEKIMRQVALNQAIDRKASAYEQSLYKKAGLDPNKSGWDLKHEADTLREQALKRLEQIYVENGVNARKARYLVGDVRDKLGPFGAKISPKRALRDKYDADIKEKTTAAVEAAKTDPEFQEKSEAFTKKMNEMNLRNEIQSKAFNKRHELNRNTGRVLFVTEREVKEAKAAYQEAINWRKAGIPAESQAVSTAGISANMVSVDSTGKINNVWVQHEDNTVEPVVGYVEPQGELTYGVSGHFVTASGRKVSGTTHYHSFKTHNYGPQKLIVAPLNGDTLKAERFTVHSVIDTGD